MSISKLPMKCHQHLHRCHFQGCPPSTDEPLRQLELSTLPLLQPFLPTLEPAHYTVMMTMKMKTLHQERKCPKFHNTNSIRLNIRCTLKNRFVCIKAKNSFWHSASIQYVIFECYIYIFPLHGVECVCCLCFVI